MIGGWGNDWISGGSGQDGVLGDDGRIYTSRNSFEYGEDLYGVLPIADEDLMDKEIYAQYGAQRATINVSGALKKWVDITPFNSDPAGLDMDDPLFDDDWADDIIFGGLDSDFLHGGTGDDAISGAEALTESYTQRRDAAGNLLGFARTDWTRPYNPGDALHFGPDHDPFQLLLDLDTGLVVPGDATDSRVTIDNTDLLPRVGEFALYDEYDPRRKLLLEDSGLAAKDGTGREWFLNNRSHDDGADAVMSDKGWGIAYSDGDDVIFGDLGNDWLVGGTGEDTLWGGFGNDLLNADDVLESRDGLNDLPDTHPAYEDLAFGGAGKDVLIANTAGDRLIDWQGDFNTFIVPFWWYSMPTISRWLVPKPDELFDHLLGLSPLWDETNCFLPNWENPMEGCTEPRLEQFLYELAESQGADPTRATDAGEDPARRGEPMGELGLVTPYDEDYWHDQIGLPSDPPGFIPFQRRDVLYSAEFEDPTTLGFTDLDNGIFGGTHLLDILFGYDGFALTLGQIHTHMGGSPAHDFVVDLGNGLALTIDIKGINVSAGGVDVDLDLGLYKPDTDIGQDPRLLDLDLTLDDPVQLLLDLEDAISDVLDPGLRELFTDDITDALEDITGGLVNVITDEADDILDDVTDLYDHRADPRADPRPARRPRRHPQPGRRRRDRSARRPHRHDPPRRRRHARPARHRRARAAAAGGRGCGRHAPGRQHRAARRLTPGHGHARHRRPRSRPAPDRARPRATDHRARRADRAAARRDSDPRPERDPAGRRPARATGRRGADPAAASSGAARARAGGRRDHADRDGRDQRHGAGDGRRDNRDGARDDRRPNGRAGNHSTDPAADSGHHAGRGSGREAAEALVATRARL